MITHDFTKIDNKTLKEVIRSLAKSGEKRLALKLYLLSRTCQRPGWTGLEVDEVRVSNTEAVQVTGTNNRGNAWKMLLSVAEEVGVKVVMEREEANKPNKSKGFTKREEASKCRSDHPGQGLNILTEREEADEEANNSLPALVVINPKEADKEASKCRSRVSRPKEAPKEANISVQTLEVASSKEAPKEAKGGRIYNTRLLQDFTPLPPIGGSVSDENKSPRLSDAFEGEEYEPPVPFVQRKPRPSRKVAEAIRGGIKPNLSLKTLLQESNLDGAIKFFELASLWPAHANQNAKEAAIIWLSCLSGGDKAEDIVTRGAEIVKASNGHVVSLRKYLEGRSWDTAPKPSVIPMTEAMLGAFR